MKLSHLIALLVFGLAFVLTGSNLARSVDIAATWGFVISIIGCIFMLIIPVLITAAGALGGGVAGSGAGGSGGGLIGVLLGALGGGALSIFMFFVPVLFAVISCLGYHFLNKWGVSGLEDKTAGITGGVLLGISFFVSFLRSLK